METKLSHVDKTEEAEQPPVAARRATPKQVATMCLAPVAVLGVLLAIGGIPKLLQHNELMAHTTAGTAATRSVSVVVAKPAPDTQHFSLPGTTQAMQYASVYARVDGYLKQRYVDIGSKVTKGQLIAEIDAPELDHQAEAASAAVDQAEAAVENAKQNLVKAQADERSSVAQVAKAKTELEYQTVMFTRYKKLASEGAVSMSDRDQYQQGYQSAVANLDAIQQNAHSAAANVKSAKAAVHVAEAAYESARATYNRFQSLESFKKVTALFDGVITKRSVDAGALISGGGSVVNTELFEIANNDHLRIWVYAPEQYIPSIHVGEPANLSFQEYPGKTFVGTVANIAGGLDQASKTLQVEVRVDNEDHKLLPGMFATVQFESKSGQQQVAIVPSTALQTNAQGQFAFTIDDQGRVHSHPVSIERDLGGAVEISSGIAAGDRVVVMPPYDLTDGTTVTAVMSK